MVVVLPAPLAPRKPKISPRSDRKRHMVDGREIAEADREILGLDARVVGS